MGREQSKQMYVQTQRLCELILHRYGSSVKRESVILVLLAYHSPLYRLQLPPVSHFLNCNTLLLKIGTVQVHLRPDWFCLETMRFPIAVVDDTYDCAPSPFAEVAVVIVEVLVWVMLDDDAELLDIRGRAVLLIMRGTTAV